MSWGPLAGQLDYKDDVTREDDMMDDCSSNICDRIRNSNTQCSSCQFKLFMISIK